MKIKSVTIANTRQNNLKQVGCPMSIAGMKNYTHRKILKPENYLHGIHYRIGGGSVNRGKEGLKREVNYD